MHENITKISLMVINNDFTETEIIKTWLDQDMRIPWQMAHCISMEEASSRINNVDLVILKPEMKGPATAKEIFKHIEDMVFEIPIIVITDESHDPNGLSTYVMEQGAADTLIRGQFVRLVDAIEFALIRQKITTDNRKTSDRTLQDSIEAGNKKYTDSENQRFKDQESNKSTLSMFMGGYSASDQNSKGKNEKK